ncbi:prepilin peptidase [Streptosporangium sp. CA-135522]|uniref:prepilin peptidase n=1 Tax=Streptosporangium sp. CA-135522 TaxID=3240072 RepID=UPI003D90EFAC
MSLLPIVAAAAGAVAGFWTRPLVVRHSTIGSEPPRRDCPRCGASPSAVPPASPPAAPPAVPFISLSAGLSAARCPRCSGRIGRIGPPPLAVELLTALALAALALRAVSPARPGVAPAGSVGEFAAYAWLAVIAVVLVFVDAAVHRLPDRLTLASYLGTVVLLAVTALLEGRFDDLLRAGLGGLALAAFYLVLFLINPAGMGLGDVKLAASLGTALGWLGWDAVVAGAFLGFVAGGLYGVALMVLRRAGRKSEIPFGPFMVAGAFAVILTGL